MKANDSDAPRGMVWAICVSQVALLTLATSEHINDGLRALGLPIAASAPQQDDGATEWSIQ